MRIPVPNPIVASARARCAVYHDPPGCPSIPCPFRKHLQALWSHDRSIGAHQDTLLSSLHPLPLNKNCLSKKWQYRFRYFFLDASSIFLRCSYFFIDFPRESLRNSDPVLDFLCFLVKCMGCICNFWFFGGGFRSLFGYLSTFFPDSFGQSSRCVFTKIVEQHANSKLTP